MGMEQRLRVEDGLWGRQARWDDAVVREGQETESTDGTGGQEKKDFKWTRQAAQESDSGF